MQPLSDDQEIRLIEDDRFADARDALASLAVAVVRYGLRSTPCAPDAATLRKRAHAQALEDFAAGRRVRPEWFRGAL